MNTRNIIWQPFELHTHTVHSDGQFTVAGLCEAAHNKGLYGVALTDHNSDSGLPELRDAANKYDLKPISGIEWTTFYGHMLVLGTNRFVDFRFVAQDGMDEALRSIRQAGGVTVLAHPWSFSNPIATGYHWEYRVTEWDCVDAMEVWHSREPNRSPFLGTAFQMWEGHLNQGHRMAATYGRDWHYAQDDIPDAVTLLGLEEGLTPLDAIRRGRTAVTMGPELLLEALEGDEAHVPGDAVPAGQVRLRVSVSEGGRSSCWQRFCYTPRRVEIVTGQGVAAAIDIALGETRELSLSLSKGWVRADLYGTDARGDCPLAFTGALYVE